METRSLGKMGIKGKSRYNNFYRFLRAFSAKGLIPQDSKIREGYIDTHAMIVCPICQKQPRAVYCPHCINTSPHLLLRHKLQLIQINHYNNELRQKIDSILTDALDNRHNSTDSANNVLARQMVTLDVLHYKKNVNKLNHKKQQLSKLVESKRDKIRLLRELLSQNYERSPNMQEDMLTTEYTDTKDKLGQITKVVDNIKAIKFQELVQWFVVRTRNNHTFPYTISFQPVVNLHSLGKLPRNIVRSSLETMIQFIHYAGDILLVDLPYTDIEIGVTRASTRDFNDFTTAITKIFINVMELAWLLQLMPRYGVSERALVRHVLHEYDLDGIFYHTITNRDISYSGVTRGRSPCELTYDTCYHEISTLVQSTSVTEEPSMLEREKWFVVE